MKRYGRVLSCSGTRDVVETAIALSKEPGTWLGKLKKMRHVRRWLTGAATLPGLLFGGCLGGCQSDEENARTLDILKQGNFRGHVTIAGKPVVLIEWGTKVVIGIDATMTADGNVDFSVPPGSSATMGPSELTP